MTATRPDLLDELYERSAASFDDWELIKEIIDESIDLALNYRQSGPSGRLALEGAHVRVAPPVGRDALGHPPSVAPVRATASCSRAGHTVPLVYATLAVLNEVLRARAERDPDPAFALPDDGRWALTWEDLLKLRRRGGLPGHAEMEGKTLFLKFNTGPSGHGMPPAGRRGGGAQAGRGGGGQGLRGRGRGRPDARRQPRDAQLGLGAGPVNLVFLLDWNDYGIDDPAISSVVHGTPSPGSRPTAGA